MKVKSYIFESGSKLEDLDFVPNLAFIFFEKEDILLESYHFLKDKNPTMEIIGINGKNANINNQIPFIINNSKVSLLLFEIDDFFIQTYSLESFKNTKVLFSQDYNKFQKTTSIIFFPFKHDANNFLDAIQDKNSMHNIYGGVYDDSNIGCFYKGKFFNDKLISVFFNQEIIEFFSIAVHGWEPVGLSFKVTKSYKNVVYEIDNAPALEVIEEYMGEISQENIDSFLHPFCVEHNKEKSLASIKEINRKDNSIEFYKYIYENQHLRITIPSSQKNMMNLIEKLLKKVQCDGLFMFSCVGRYAYYKDLLEFEIEKVATYLDVPFAGFLTYGEIGSNNIHTKSILQNQTMNLVFFRGK